VRFFQARAKHIVDGRRCGDDIHQVSRIVGYDAACCGLDAANVEVSRIVGTRY